MLATISIINGPNLNLLGRREKTVYGLIPFDTYLDTLRAAFPGLTIHYFQSNHEGAILDELHRTGFKAETGIVLNAAGLTHTSVALRDAIAAIEAPVVEVHISDIYKREPFRWHSYITDVCVAHFIGHGLEGYRMAIDFLKEM